jgi:hypothetical protein
MCTLTKRTHLQPFEDTVEAKLVPWIGKQVTMAGRTTLVKAVLASVVIYFSNVLDIPLEVLMKIDAIRSFLWAACDKVLGGNVKSTGRWWASQKLWRPRDPQPNFFCLGSTYEIAFS